MKKIVFFLSVLMLMLPSFTAVAQNLRGDVNLDGLLVTGPNGNTMFLPAAGDRNGDTLSSAGLGGYSWSRTLSSSDPSGAYSIVFSLDTGDGLREGHYYRYIGFPVRAVRVSQN